MTSHASVDPGAPGQNGPERRPRRINPLLRPNPSCHANIAVTRGREYDPAPCKTGTSDTMTSHASVDPGAPGQNGPERRPRRINPLLRPNPSCHANIAVTRGREYDPAPCKTGTSDTVRSRGPLPNIRERSPLSRGRRDGRDHPATESVTSSSPCSKVPAHSGLNQAASAPRPRLKVVDTNSERVGTGVLVASVEILAGVSFWGSAELTALIRGSRCGPALARAAEGEVTERELWWRVAEDERREAMGRKGTATDWGVLGVSTPPSVLSRLSFLRSFRIRRAVSQSRVAAFTPNRYDHVANDAARRPRNPQAGLHHQPGNDVFPLGIRNGSIAKHV
ncbi:hypothetical protein C4D60_Mb03t18420 [Musa balbisiana]|uniref:Uncharacterized protein n=1 Tax=Musa balbisiana TaxID=52838 RepID=A0A4S8JCK3_MUSBA|nr:hypothetical protein C4D60_Mb03t18420 [Musa balbisiana]